MLRLKKLFSFGTNKALNSYASLSSRNFTSFTLRPISSRSLRPRNLIDLGNFSRYLSKKVTDPDDPEDGQYPQIVDLKYLVVDTHVNETVSANPIFILHGLLGCKENWQSMAKQLNLRLGRKVYVFDLRNHGSSPRTVGFSYDSMCNDLVYFMRMSEIERASMIGHSMGGRVAMLVAMRYPKLVQSLIAVDISPMGVSPNMKGIMKLLRDIKNLMLDRDYTLKEARKQAAIQLKEKKYDDKLINFLLLNMVENDRHTNWQWKFNLESIMKNYEPEILNFLVERANCDTRALFIGGTESDYLTPNQEKAVKHVFSGAEFTYIEGAGHWVHVDRPADFINAVVDFLDKDPNRLQEEAEKKPLGRPVQLAYQKYDEHIDETRSKVPVIILHGLLGSKQNWNSMAGLINKRVGRVVYALDARNHGDSPHAEIFTYDLMLGDLLVFLNKHNITKVSLIGHSMGGRVTMLMGMLYPILVHSMVVVDISPGRPIASMSGIRQLLYDLKDLNIDPLLPAREARNQAAAILREKVKDERVIAFILMNLIENTKGGDIPGVTSRRNWTWRFNLDSIVKYFDKDINEFPFMRKNCPTRSLFIGGAESDFIKPKDEPVIKSIFPLAEFEYIEGAGHWVHAEKPKEFLDVVSKFLINDT